MKFDHHICEASRDLRNESAHTLRQTFGTLLKANGENVATVQALMRHANVSVTMNTYVQAVTPAKRKAQRGIIKQIREVALDGPRSKSETPASA